MEAKPRPSSGTPLFVHGIFRAFRRALRAFESERRSERKNGKSTYEATWTLRVTVEPDEVDGGWVAECLDLPGCVSQGDTREEAMENIIDAITGVMAVRMQAHLPEALLKATDDGSEVALSV